MPLKHALETRLVLLLGAAILLTGFLVSTLPPLPSGVIPWSILFVATVAYPVLLYPLFKRDRADKPFRLLHWFPCAMTVVWLVLRIAESLYAPLGMLTDTYVWGWTLPAVAAGVLGLITFCLQVIRRREKRVPHLVTLLAVFMVLAVLSQNKLHWGNQFAAKVWRADLSDVIAVGSGSDSQILDPSSDPKEEAWRESLRDMKRREEALARMKGDSSSSLPRVSSAVSGIASSVMSSSSSSSASAEALPDSLQPGGTGAHLREVAVKPDALPESGFALGAFLLSLMAAYCAVLHDRARRRTV